MSPEGGSDRARRVERGIRLHGEHGKVGARDGVRVRRAGDPSAAELCRDLLRAGGVARADHHVVLGERNEPCREGAAEAAGAAEDRHSHASAPAACTAACASLRAALSSVISVCVTTVWRMPGTGPAAASASSITSTSIRPS